MLFDITLQKYGWILISLSRTGICFTPKSKDLNKKLYSKTSKCIAVMWRKVFFCPFGGLYNNMCICGFVFTGCQTSPYAQRLVGYVKTTQPLFSGSWATFMPQVSASQSAWWDARLYRYYMKRGRMGCISGHNGVIFQKVSITFQALCSFICTALQRSVALMHWHSVDLNQLDQLCHIWVTQNVISSKLIPI